jgi:hypothetical protein
MGICDETDLPCQRGRLEGRHRLSSNESADRVTTHGSVVARSDREQSRYEEVLGAAIDVTRMQALGDTSRL